MTKVAIVEDNATLRKYLTELIGHTRGLQCVCACASAEEAFVEIPKHRPNVVLMDIHLPGESGIACTARLRGKMPDLQVIMLTVYKDIKMIFQALKAGACGYVLKSVADQDLVAACRAAMRGEPFLYPAAVAALIRDYLDRAARGEAAPSDPLTPRELEVVKLVAEGHTSDEIAEALVIAKKTVEHHRSNILEKLGMRDRVDLTRYAIRRGLVEP